MNLRVLLDDGELHVDDGRLVASSPDGTPVLDARGLVVAPGLVDLQVNGAAGVDVTDQPERLWEVAAALPAHGVTAFLPTLITAEPQARDRALATLAAGPPEGFTGALPLGLHLEGPMIAAARRGAHPEHLVRPPSAELVDGWSRDAGVAVVTLAPELPGALDVVRLLVDRGVVVSVGHTDAPAAAVRAALDAGARCFTHLYNAMPPLHHREPGPVGVALAAGPDVAVGMLVDGHHHAPEVVRLTWRALGPDRFLSVSDATAGLGLPAGEHRLGDQRVVVADGAVRLTDGTLAGSATSLLGCLRVLVEQSGCSVADALATATGVPAGLLGDPERGRLVPGARGDLVVLTPELDLVATVVGGAVVHRADAEPGER